MSRDATSAAEWRYQNELSRRGEQPDDATIRSARFVMHIDCNCLDRGCAHITCPDCCGLGVRTIVVPFERILELVLESAREPWRPSR